MRPELLPGTGFLFGATFAAIGPKGEWRKGRGGNESPPWGRSLACVKSPRGYSTGQKQVMNSSGIIVLWRWFFVTHASLPKLLPRYGIEPCRCLRNLFVRHTLLITRLSLGVPRGLDPAGLLGAVRPLGAPGAPLGPLGPSHEPSGAWSS